MSDVMELAGRLEAVTEEDAYAQPWTFGVLCREAAQALRALQAEREAAVLAEREACAKVADSFTCGCCGMDGQSSATIRARTNMETSRDAG